MVTYPANISTTKTRRPGRSPIRGPVSSIPTGSSRTADGTGNRLDPRR